MNTGERPGWTPQPGDAGKALHRDLTPVARPNIFVLLWRWRWELALTLGVPAGLTALITRFGWVSTLIGIAAAGAVLAWPEVRHWLAAHARCIIMAHRVRTGCAQAWIQTRSGKLPVILLTTTQPWGERMYIWCRAGICPEDFEGAGDVLRSACWATDIYVTPSARRSDIVILDLIRANGPMTDYDK
ncbi:MAG TPA: hypothetical protein VMA72_04615 [Streptosporangiaceae bacterium]|nr:hypothetical protein [Streptosporangiaceae bacterium]